MKFNYQHPVFRKARDDTFRRSEGWCQFCGLTRATQAHHWRGYKGGDYKPEEETTADELIGLCDLCHKLVTTIRSRHAAMIKYEKLLREKEETLKEKQKRLVRIERELDQRHENIDAEIDAEVEARTAEEWEEIEEAKRQYNLDLGLYNISM